MRSNLLMSSVLLVTLLLSACGTPKPTGDAKSESIAAATTAGSVPISGKTAFWAMYKSAHSWAPDLAPLALESKSIPGVKNQAGKAGMWTATFGSRSQRQARVFTYSVIASPPDVYKGVTVGNPLTWNGPTPTALSFTTSDFAVDSEAAYTAASAQAAVWIKSHPDKEASLTLGNAARFKEPVWYVLWGDKKSGYSVLVDAKTGSVIK
jgi:hypothetical protein